MNFKEVYKSANDEIHGDRSLLYSLGSKKEKVQEINIYKFASLAAATFIVVIIAVMPKPVMEVDKATIETSVTQAGGEEVLEYSAMKKMVEEDLTPENIPVAKSVSLAAEESVVGLEEGAMVLDESPREPEKSTPGLEECDVVEESLPEDYEESATSDSININDASNVKTRMASSGGGGGVAMASVGEMAEISFSDYLKETHLSVDLELPEGMIANLPESVWAELDENGKYVYPVVSFYFTEDREDGRFISVISQKDGSLCDGFFDGEYELSVIDETQLVIIKSGEETKTYITKNGVDIIVTAVGLKEDEVVKLLHSII